MRKLKNILFSLCLPACNSSSSSSNSVPNLPRHLHRTFKPANTYHGGKNISSPLSPLRTECNSSCISLFKSSPTKNYNQLIPDDSDDDDDHNNPISQLLSSIRGGGGILEKNNVIGTHKDDPPPSDIHHHHHHPKIALYKKCAISVLLWITTGTIFYSVINHPHWSIPTSFFYAVDAGMSIGFCIPEVTETTVTSRAFSIVFILAGASVVGGALALLVSDLLDESSEVITRGYRMMLERDAFARYDTDGDGVISRLEMVGLLEGMGYGSQVHGATADVELSRDGLMKLCDELFHQKPNNEGITMQEFIGTFQHIESLLRDKRFETEHGTTPSSLSQRRRYQQQRVTSLLGRYFKKSRTLYLVFTLWIIVGILWGIRTQKWDPITATHFAISALATGGLTAPPVDATGILPNSTAIFVGFYCLLGIPLFYCVMGHYAKMLVSKNLLDMEEFIIAAPLKRYEYDLVAKSLCSPGDEYIHLSDFLVMHFLRRGGTDLDTVRLVRNQFEALDVDKDGVLTFEEATRGLEQFYKVSDG
eukprot:CAMPEP_0198260304 /NCGR_PEP_ID=MMETSP1447-20131203/9312_1 /TAXON_ID=420782 /ORGANISM="Chaetoceros dichaeta, Strain CCMP1751" /LENGTH=532 /DNA_ID=CAMNT_0043947935 /DNA_START=113 /DNA_END=1711 /DNA_ORIENTATION=+